MYYNISQSCQMNRELLSVIYEDYLGRKNNGFFVEVGAFDGETHSNTSAFADLGWKGWYIEPHPKQFQQCIKRHIKNSQIKVSNLALGDKEGIVELNLSGELSSVSSEWTNILKNLWWSKDLISNYKIKVEQQTLNRYLSENDVPKNFDVLVVDVEGYEKEVFEGLDLNIWQPKIIIAELEDIGETYKVLRPNLFYVFRKMKQYNYEIVYKDFINTIFVRDRFSYQ